MSGELIKYEVACRALHDAVTVDEVKEVMSKADAIRVYGRQAKNTKLENDAKIIRWRAIRRLGELMDLKPKAKGGRPASETGVENTPVKPETLEDQGIDKNLAKLARQYAAMEESSFDRLVARCQAHAAEKLPLDILAAEEKAARRKAAQEAFAGRVAQGCTVGDLVSHAKDGKRYGAIYADPPWEFKAWSGAGKDRSADNHYKTGGIEEIKALPVADLAAENCALFIWAVMPELPGALEVIKAWGFEYKTCAFNWMKQNKSGEGLFLGMGYWTRANAEICLLATRGKPERLDAGVPQALLHPVMEHSRKPDEFHERIQRLVGGPYLELYARREREGWATWGNEIERAKFLPPHDEETGEVAA